jgi:hypothetical protein
MTDRTPQQFGGIPDNTTDSTEAVQAAIDAWQPGDKVVIAGGTFRTSAKLTIAAHGLVLGGDGGIRARIGHPSGSAILEVTGEGVRLDGDGLLLDQNNIMVSGSSIIAKAPGLEVKNLLSRETQQAFLRLDAGATDLELASCDHLGRGFGVVSFDAAGLTRITIRDCLFVHPGTGTPGDGVQLNCPTHGASEVSIIGCTARGYVGEASQLGMGFGFARVTDGRIIGCRAESCEGDGFHFEHESHRWLCADLQAIDIGLPEPAGGNGSGLIAYDSDEVKVVLVAVRNCGFHGIALSGQGKSGVPSQLRHGGLIEHCTVDTTRRDGIHLTAQQGFRIDRNRVRDPSLGNPGQFAGIRVGRQGDTSIENRDGTGSGNVVIQSGSTTPLGAIVIRPESIDVTIDGVSGNGSVGEPFSDGTYWSDGTGWLDAA